MKTVDVAAMNALDHDDVKELRASGKHRQKYRIKIIQRFMRWQGSHKEIWQGQGSMSEESIAINRQKVFGRMLMGFGAFANFFLYQAFLTGIYNYRNRELLNMRRVPFVAKVALSTGVSAYMCHLLYTDHLYDADLYRVALKYRPEYDQEFQSNK